MVTNILILGLMISLAPTFSAGAVQRPDQFVSDVWVVVVINGREAMGFAPRTGPYTDGAPSVYSEAGVPDLRTRDGAPVKGFRFHGWRDGEVYRIVAFAVVPADRAPKTAPDDVGAFKRIEFGRLEIRPGEEKPFPGMKEIGMTPWTIRVALRS